MDKKKVYFVQTGCVINNEHFLPYAAGIIAAYSFEIPQINACYELSDIIYKCDDFEQTLNGISNPSVVAFSNYMWNYKFNLKLAQAIKEKTPECITIFGGHQISDTAQWLADYPFVDFAVFGEGEKAVSDILLALCNKGDRDSIPNISYRRGSEIISTEKRKVCMDINSIPSPYITGVFDKIIKNNPDDFAAIIETSRGCPYHCAYCDWGDYDAPVRHFDVERVKKEIEWVGRNSLVFAVLTDSNFGICDTDELIIDALVESKKKYGYPKAIEVAFAKYSPQTVYSMNKKLYENGMSRGATLSMQSLSPQALKNIGRENITKDKFSELIRLYSESGIPSYTELILGLPGETYESFCEGIDYLLDNGQHNSIHVFSCEILPNAVMGSSDYIKKHGIEVLNRDFILRNGAKSEGVSGSSKIIVATETMSREMFLKSMLYAFVIQTFHNFGLCRAISMYFHYSEGMKYYEFYNALINWFENNPSTYAGSVFERFREKYIAFVNGTGSDTYENPAFGETQFNLSDGAFLEIANECESFYADIALFVYSLTDKKELVDDLINFQQTIIRKPSNRQTTVSLLYSWTDYYNGLIKNGKAHLRKEKNELTVFASDEYDSLLSYVSAVAIKGRRIGKSIALNDTNSYSAIRSEEI